MARALSQAFTQIFIFNARDGSLLIPKQEGGSEGETTAALTPTCRCFVLNVSLSFVGLLLLVCLLYVEMRASAQALAIKPLELTNLVCVNENSRCHPEREREIVWGGGDKSVAR